MTEEKRLAERLEGYLAWHENEQPGSPCYGSIGFLLEVIASRDAEIERLRSDYNSTITYNIDERAKLASLLIEKDAEIERLRTALEQVRNAAFYHMVRHADERGDRKVLGALKEVAIKALKDAPEKAELARLRAQPAAAHPWYGPCDALGPDGQCAECLKLRAQAAVEDAERARQCLWQRLYAVVAPELYAAIERDVAATLTAARQDARRQALEEAALWHENQSAAWDRELQHLNKNYSGESSHPIWLKKRISAEARVAEHKEFANAIRALADKPATISPDIIPLFRAYRRAVEASPVSNVLELQEWRDLCAAMNAIDAAEGAW